MAMQGKDGSYCSKELGTLTCQARFTARPTAATQLRLPSPFLLRCYAAEQQSCTVPHSGGAVVHFYPYHFYTLPHPLIFDEGVGLGVHSTLHQR